MSPAVKKILATVIIVLIPPVLVALGFRTGAIPHSGESFTLNRALKSSAQPPDFFFEEMKGIFPGVAPADPKLFPAFSRRMPGVVAVCDLDGDGWDDVITLFNRPDRYGVLKVFKNDHGLRFLDVTREWGFGDVPENSHLTAVGCADLNNSGWVDVVLAGFGQNILIFKNEHGKRFTKVAEIPAYDETRALNIFDINGDGLLDIYTGNFREQDDHDERKKMRDMATIVNETLVNNHNGGGDRIYVNQGNWQFAPLPKSTIGNRGLTWAAAVGDFDGSGRNGVYLAQGFGRDKLFLPDGKGGFRDDTDKSLGKLRSRNSMSAEVVDLDDTGLPAIFVSNSPQPGLTRGMNNLWVNNPAKPGTFTDEAVERGVDACGWAWGAQFADLNQDGYLDLLVVTGANGSEPDNPYWYPFMFWTGVPRPLRRRADIGGPLTPNTSIAANQPKCLFLGGADGKFHDQATQAGINDLRISRGVVAFDFDHDGAEDILTGNPYEGPVLFKNHLKKPGSWLAVKLQGTKSNVTGIGSKITVTTNRRTVRRSYFPLNGFQSQQGSETFFTFRNGEEPKTLEVRWPSGRVSKLNKIPTRMRITVKEL